MSQTLFPPEAMWIGSDHAFDLHEVYLRFRSPAAWRLARTPGRALLRITADSRYKLWVNGRFVARGPARSLPQAQAVDELEIASYLQAGANTIAVQVYQPGYSHFSYVHRGVAGMLAHLICDGETVLVSDTGWRTSRDPSYASDVAPVSIYLSGVERADLNLADAWIAPGFVDGAWQPARLVAPAIGPPWSQLQARSLPLLGERPLALTLQESRQGFLPDAPDDPHAVLRAGWAMAEARQLAAAADGWFEPALAENEAVYWVFDVGRGYSFQGQADVQGAGGGERLSLSYSEKLAGDHIFLSDPATYCRVRMTDQFVLRAGDQTVEPFSLRGGRFLLVQLTGPTAPDFRIRLRAQAAEYPLEVTKPIASADPLLNEIIVLCEETFRACLLDGFVDNPWRESAQWLGDALPISLIMSSMSDDLRPMRRVLEMAAQGAYADGVLPGVLPSEAHAYVVVDYNFLWVELLALYARMSDDDGFVDEMWPVLVKLLNRFHQDVDESGLLWCQPGRRLFIDWSPESKLEPNGTYNLLYLLALQKASGLAGSRGATVEQMKWQERAGRLQQSARKAFWVDGRWLDDSEGTTFSQLTAALACLTGSTLPPEEAALLEAIAARSLDPDDDHDAGKMVLASPFMHHRIFEALRQGGRSESVVEIIRRRWGRWVQAGFPTAWENWNVDFPDGSQCHAFSAHPRYHLAQIARERGGL